MSGVANNQAAARSYNIDFERFRSDVSGKHVLDGDLLLTGERTFSISKVNYGGSVRRFLSSIFSGDASKTTSRQQNEEVRRAFLESAENYVKGHVPADKQQELLSKIKTLLTSQSMLDVPLSRRTVRMVVDAVDVAARPAGPNAQAVGQDRPKQAGDITFDGVFGKFTLNKVQYTAMFKQALLRLEKDPQVGAEMLAAYEAQVDSYLKIFEKGGNLGNLGVFFMGSLDMESVIKKMTSFIKAGILPHRIRKGTENKVEVLSKDMVGELEMLRSRRMTEGDVVLSRKVDVTRLVEANKPDVQVLEARGRGVEGLPPKPDQPSGPRKLDGGAKLMTDLIFNDNLLEMQEFQFNDGERIIQTLSKNFEAFKNLCLDIDACERGLTGSKKVVADADERICSILVGEDEDARGGLSDTTKDFFAAMRLFCGGKEGPARPLAGKIVELIRQINTEVFGGKPTATKITRSSLYANCEKLYGIAEKLDVENKIVAALRNAVGDISDAIVSALTNNAITGDSENDIANMEQMNDKLLLKALPTYFKNADPVSLRRMFASALRQSRENTAVGELDHLDYGAFLMGSGPYMLKLLQGVHLRDVIGKAGEEGLSEDQRQVLDGVNRIKTSMPGLDVDAIYAHLMALTDKNDCPFESVVLKKDLGAASVGVTYLCEVKDAHGASVDKPVVLKMLRPGVEEQLKKEKQLFADVAVELGLTREVEQTAESILRELDLRTEFDALKTGLGVYSDNSVPQMEYEIIDGVKLTRPFAGQVDSVKTVSIGGKEVVATKNCMVMDVAPGMSVAKWFEKLHDEQAAGFGFAEDQTFEDARKHVEEKRATLQDLHQAMLEVAAKLVLGLCDPEGGYFHGDLHAGNMMYQPGVNGAPGKITLIDYGKGTKLDSSQADAIRKLLAVAAVGEKVSPFVLGESLVDIYRQIMRTEMKDPAYEIDPELRDRLLVKFSDLAKDGIEGGIGLLASFGRAAAAAGAPLPLVFFDFFGTCGKLSGEIRQVEHYMDELDRSYVESDAFKTRQNSLLDELQGAFADLFPVGTNFDSNLECSASKTLDEALHVMTGTITGNPVRGLYSVLNSRRVSTMDFGDGKGLDAKVVVDKLGAGDDMTDVMTYSISPFDAGSEKLQYAQMQMNGLLHGVSSLKANLAGGNGLPDNSVQTEIDNLKGASSAFRKMFENAKIPGSLDQTARNLRLDKLRDDCLAMKGKIDLQISMNEGRMQALDSKLAAIYKKAESREKLLSEEKRTVVYAMIYSSSSCGMGLRGTIGRENISLDGRADAVEKIQEVVKAEGPDVIDKYIDSVADGEYWRELGLRIREVGDVFEGWKKLSKDLGKKIEDLNDRRDHAFGQVDESRRLLQTPQKVLEVLGKIDSAVKRLDELRLTMKGSKSLHRFGYDGEIRNRPTRNFHLYGRRNLEFEKEFYTDEVEGGISESTNLSIALTKEETEEYRRLYDFIKKNYTEKPLAGLKDPGVEPKEGEAVGPVVLTRKNLADLRDTAGAIENTFSADSDPVVSVMQSQLDQKFAAGIGRDDDTGAIKIVTTHLDKLRKHRASSLQNDPQSDQLQEFKSACETGDSVDYVLNNGNKAQDVLNNGNKAQDVLKYDVVKYAGGLLSLTDLHTKYSETNPANDEFTRLEIRQVREEVEAEIRCRIKKRIGDVVKNRNLGYPADSDAFCARVAKAIYEGAIVVGLETVEKQLRYFKPEIVPRYHGDTDEDYENRVAKAKEIVGMFDRNKILQEERIRSLLVRDFLADAEDKDIDPYVVAALAAPQKT